MNKMKHPHQPHRVRLERASDSREPVPQTVQSPVRVQARRRVGDDDLEVVHQGNRPDRADTPRSSSAAEGIQRESGAGACHLERRSRNRPTGEPAMVRGCRAGKLARSELVELLKSDGVPVADVPASIVGMLDLASGRNLVTEEQVRLTWPTVVRSVKCGIRDVVPLARVRERLDEYVVAWSMLYRRGTLISNLAVDRVLGCVDRPFRRSWKCELTDESRTAHAEAVAAFVAASTASKQAFLPERWAAARTPLDARVASVAAEHAGDLAHLLPRDWLGITNGRVTGWDNALNKMSGTFSTNASVDVRFHAIRRAVAHASRNLGVHLDTARRVVSRTRRSWRVWSNVSADAFEEMVHMRCSIAGLEDVESVSFEECVFEPKVVTPQLLALHRHLLNALDLPRCTLPVAGLGRKFAYVDDKIAGFMRLEEEVTPAGERRGAKRKRKAGDEPPRESSSWRDVVAIDPASFNAARSEARRRKRRRIRRRFGSSKKGRRRGERGDRARRRRRAGCGRMPRDAEVRSIQTDGVSVVLAFHVPVKRPEVVDPEARVPEEDHRTSDAGVGFVGIDLGRAKLATAAVLPADGERLHDADGRPAGSRTAVLARKEYLARTFHDQRRRWEESRHRRPSVRDALLELSTADPRDFSARMRVEARHASALLGEFVVDKGRACWALRSYAGKRACLDRFAQRIISEAAGSFERGSKRVVVVGVGDGGFGHGGRGEKSVPVQANLASIHRRAVAWNKDVGSGGAGVSVHVEEIDEFRTTVCCCRCGEATAAAVSPYGRPSRRLRQCSSTTCCSETGLGRVCDRDVQAARNMAWLTMLKWRGESRPVCMQRGMALPRHITGRAR